MPTQHGPAGRAGTVARGLGALLLLGALLVGLPALLLGVVGLPTSVPSATVVLHALTGPDDGTVFTAAAATVGWLAWALFAGSTLIEAIALAGRGRPAPAATRPGLPALAGPRRLAAHLLTAVILLGHAAHPGATAAAPPAITAVALAADRPPPAIPPPAQAAAAKPGAQDGHPAMAPGRPTAQPGVEVVVVRGDTLWGLAERHLGAGGQWPRIAQANYGRPQPDGRTLTDAHWIYPGWRLVVPTAAPGPAPRSAPQRHRVAGATAPTAGGASTPAPHPNPPPTPARSAAARPDVGAARLPSSRATAPDGSELPPARSPETPQLPRPEPVRGTLAPPAAGSRSGAAGQTELLAASLAGAGLLAAGLAAELRRRRRRQSRNRPSGYRIHVAEADPARAEAAIRAAADVGGASALQAILRSLATVPAGGAGGSPAAAVLAVQLSPTALTVRLTGPRPAPDGWTAAAGDAWRLDPAGRAHLLAAPPRSVVDPLPGLVTAGSTADGDYLLLNLAGCGVATLTGPDQTQVHRQLQTMALELATAGWGGPWFELATVGLPELNGFDRAVPYPDLTAALAALRAWVGDAEDACREHAAADAVTARAAGRDDDRLQPMVLVSAHPASAGELAELAELTSRLPGLAGALLPAGGNTGRANDAAPGGAVLELTDAGTLRIPALDAELHPVALAPGDITAIQALFATADAPARPAPRPPDLPQNLAPEIDALPHLADDPGPAQPEEDTPAAGAPAFAAGRLRVVDADDNIAGRTDSPDPAPPVVAPAVLVRLLGPPDVTGSARPVTTSHGLELLLALALRGPAGLDGHRLADLLGAGGDTAVTAAYRQQIVSRVRAQLGPAGDGRPRILYTAAVYRLHPEVGTDLELFRAYTAQGSRDGLRAALALVRGPALDGVDFWWLPDLAGAAQAEIRASVVDAAERLATLDLAAGDPSAAVAAACAGLRVDPDERLFRGLMRAHAAAGNLAGVARAWQECLAVLAELAVPAPHPQTVATYREASGPATDRPASAAGRH